MMWVTLVSPRFTRAKVALGLLVSFAVLQGLLLVCVGVVRTDSQRAELVRERSGPVAAELAAHEPSSPQRSTQFLRSSTTVPSTQGLITWTRVVRWNGPVELPGVEPALLHPGRSLVSPAVQALAADSGNPHIRHLIGDNAIVLPPEALAGFDEMVIVTELPRSGYRSIRPFEVIPAPDEDFLSASGPPVAPRGASGAAIFLMLGAMLSMLGISRLVALGRSTDLATLRLIGFTLRRVRAVVAAQILVLSLLASLVVGGLVVGLGESDRWVRFLGIDYAISELVPGIVEVVVLVVFLAGLSALTSFLGLRRLQMDPLGVRLRRRKPPPAATAPLLWCGGAATLGIVAFVAGTTVLPDAVVLLSQLVGILAVGTGLLAGMPALVRGVGRLLRAAPLPAFVAGKHLASDPQASARGVFAIGGVALAVGLAGALGPASFPEERALELSKGAIQIRTPDGTVNDLRTRLTASIDDHLIATFSSAQFDQPGPGSSQELFIGACSDLLRAGVSVSRGECRPGHAIYVGQRAPLLKSWLDGVLTRRGQQRDLRLRVSGTASASTPWIFLSSEEPPPRPDTLIARSDPQTTLGTLIGEAARSGSAFEILVPDLSAQSARYEHAQAQATVDALAVWLLCLATGSTVAIAVFSVVERRSTLVSLRYAGLSRSSLASCVATMLSAPTLIAAVFGGISGFVLGTAFGHILDGRSGGSPSSVLYGIAVMTIVCVALSGCVGGFLSASSSPQPQDARLA